MSNLLERLKQKRKELWDKLDRVDARIKRIEEKSSSENLPVNNHETLSIVEG